jgi:two-component system OmpR family sensor kinase
MMPGYLSPRRWGGPPLVLQILALLLAGLIVAQLVTLLLTMILPPAPTPQHSLAEIGAALQGVPTAEKRPDPLQRVIQPGPPDLNGAGWLVSTRSEKELAERLGVDPADVRLAFYTPLPFAGTSAGRKTALKANDGPILGWSTPAKTGVEQASLLILAQATVPPPRPFPPNDLPAGAKPPSRDMLPPGMLPDGAQHGGPRRDRVIVPPGSDAVRPQRPEPLIRFDPTPADRNAGGIWIRGDNGETVPDILRNPHRLDPSQTGTVAPTNPNQPSGGTTTSPPGSAVLPPGGQTLQPGSNFEPRIGGPGGAGQFPGQNQGQPLGQMPFQAMPSRSSIVPEVQATPTRRPAIEGQRLPSEFARPAQPVMPRGEAASPGGTAAVPGMLLRQPPQAEVDIRRPEPASSASPEPVIPLPGRAGGLFGLAPAPFVEGDFVAALHLGDGRWAVVQPAPEGFPNAWQRRVLLWFAIAFAVVAPLGWLFARRIVKPLSGFATAAEQLGRDPAAPVLDLDGPAEVGRAARAFNIMQSRLKSFVDDRTAMIGAISHDLRTPLTRLRFRIEDVDDDDVRAGMIEEVEQMEAMITSVLSFIRDASSPGIRERLDLGTILEDVVEDAAMVGGRVTIERSEPAPVEVDVLGMRRLFSNLVENAVKYGDCARVRLHIDADEAVAEVIDDGPGVPEEDYERAFEPFYRAANAVSSDKRGSGLGLAVCRSIARAHGGDVRFARSVNGFVTELRVPLSEAKAA